MSVLHFVEKHKQNKSFSDQFEPTLKRVLYNNGKKIGEMDPVYPVVCFLTLMSIDNLTPVPSVVLSLVAKLGTPQLKMSVFCFLLFIEKGNFAILRKK